MSTAYHSQYWAHALTLRGSGGDIAALSRSIANARVDLNPHQIDAALFALRSPFTNGAILADEVGLGKTVEAGIVLSQKWAERRRRILIVVPAMLRKQWQQELGEKFFIPSEVLDTQVISRLRKNGGGNPFDQQNKAIICSYNFAAARASSVAQVPWDAVVIDEAHRLRNVHRSRTRLQNNPAARKTMAHQIADAVGNAPKLLLTATPLQNSLLELFSLVSVIDSHVFGDAASFREQFVNSTDELSRNVQLKQRIAPVCTRALRKQVTEYIPFTNRVPITQEFLPSEQEQNLYDSITTYLQRDVLYALPASQRQLITMVLRKLLASSTFAIARTLRSLAGRLENLRDDMELLDDDDIEGVTELADEYAEDAEDEGDAKLDPEQLKGELSDLRRYADLASCIGRNAKGDALLPALKIAFAKAEALGSPRKAVIFTESRETQTYLYDLLSANGYEGQVVTINGTNNQPHHADIYQRWIAKHEGTDRLSGSRAVDMKAAIVEHFRDEATILVATEAAAEGVNLQFCSLVVNFDLPWNPQRIEQRIGRCHRYGQKHDVVVVNFLNRRNEADKRVYELLSEKFRLFGGVFGASDEVLGALESGVDIERAIARRLPVTEVTLDYTNHPAKISVLEPLVGQSGWLQVARLTVEAVEVDEFLVFSARTDHNQVVDEEICRKLLTLPARIEEDVTAENAKNAEKEGSDAQSQSFAISALFAVNSPHLKKLRDAAVQERLGEIDTRNGQFFDEEVQKLDRWSEDLKLSLEHEIKELDKQIRELRRSAALAQALQDKLAHQKQLRDLERRRNGKRRELFDAQDAIDQQREDLIGKIEKRLKHTSEVRTLFTIRWRVA